MYFLKKLVKILNLNFISLIFKAKGANQNFARCTIQLCDVTLCRQVAVSQGSINHVTGQARPGQPAPGPFCSVQSPERTQAFAPATLVKCLGEGGEGCRIWDNLPLLTPTTDIGRLSDLETIICVCFRYLNMAKNERTNEILVDPLLSGSSLGGEACQTRNKQHSFAFRTFKGGGDVGPASCPLYENEPPTRHHAS